MNSPEVHYVFQNEICLMFWWNDSSTECRLQFTI